MSVRSMFRTGRYGHRCKAGRTALGWLLLLGLGSVAMAVEEAPYTVVAQDGRFEVRDYPALFAAEVSVPGDQDQAASAGFRLLAGYIFGGNRAQRRIAMTAPVVQSPTPDPTAGVDIAMTAPVMQSADKPDSWVVRFILPTGYTLANLPVPNDPRVHLVALPGARYAVVRFSGLAYPGDVARQTDALRAFVAARHLQTVGAPVLARFNPPWTLWFLRRNEVMLPVRVESGHP